MRKLLSAFVAGGAVLVIATGTATAQAPPPPTAANGAPVATVGHIDGTPTSIAMDTSTNTLFIGAAPSEETNKGGGIYAVSPGGSATLVSGSPPFVAGLAFADGTLYASALTSQRGPGTIMALSQWNGTSFGSTKTIFNARRTVGTINGIAIGPDGRIYGGGGLMVDVNKKGRLPRRPPAPHPFSVFSITTSGTHFKLVARGLRQPWQMTFPQGSPNPYVTVLSQDAGRIPPDAIVVAKPGANFGFPGCFAGVGIACKGKRYAKPLVRFPKHASPMGIGSLGSTLYVALFGKMAVDTVPVAGGTPKPFLTGFVAPVVLTNVLEGSLYAADLSGFVYQVVLTP